MKIEGGCLCGQVRFEAEADPLFQACCHCKNCQKSSGTAFSVVVGVPAPALSVTGETATYEDRGDSGGQVDRIFCPRCGSSLMSRPASMPALAVVKAGALDDNSWVKPAVHVWTESAMACTVIPEGVATFGKSPG